MRFPFIGKRPPVQPDLEKEDTRPLPTDADVQAYLDNGPKRAEASLATPSVGFSNEKAAVSSTSAASSNTTRELIGVGESKG